MVVEFMPASITEHGAHFTCLFTIKYLFLARRYMKFSQNLIIC